MLDFVDFVPMVKEGLEYRIVALLVASPLLRSILETGSAQRGFHAESRDRGSG